MQGGTSETPNPLLAAWLDWTLTSAELQDLLHYLTT